MRRATTSVTITDPFVKYTTLTTAGVYQPDAAQFRLAHHLQKVYLRLKDYQPAHEYRVRLRQIARAVDATHLAGGPELASPSHPIRRNPLFARFFRRRRDDDGPDSLALTRVLTSYETALEIDSPKGLFLSGEVGTGKSMLLDLLAEGLPTRHKRRWHFNTFMLHAFSRLEEFRKSRSHLAADSPEYSLLWLAKEMVETSPILFLDEFQLPDRAASKIMSNLFVAFFQLGGVLVASSNRMPEELEKAAGGYYVPPATGGLVERVLRLGKGKGRPAGELFGQSSDFAAFLEVLKARCDFWHMEGTRDWRRRESALARSAEPTSSAATPASGALPQVESSSGPAPAAGSEVAGQPEKAGSDIQRPAMYLLPSDGEESWTALVARRTGPDSSSRGSHSPSWEPAALVVYGRKLTVPRQSAGISYWNFDELASSMGPADYITLASNYHTFIIDQVPVMSVSMKNEARRFITFLDALYESRCRLVIRAEAGPDDLFFPETRTPQAAAPDGAHAAADPDSGVDATYSETIAEVYQDQVSPFRPNVSYYSEAASARYDPDGDAGAGGEEQAPKVDFGKTSAFTGEDERFAYKRATSRLWELCSAQWHARDGDWWRPLPREARHWEVAGPARPPQSSRLHRPAPSEITMGPSVELEEPAGLERFRVAQLRGGGQ